jgi:hypothetical protein
MVVLWGGDDGSFVVVFGVALLVFLEGGKDGMTVVNSFDFLIDGQEVRNEEIDRESLLNSVPPFVPKTVADLLCPSFLPITLQVLLVCKTLYPCVQQCLPQITLGPRQGSLPLRPPPPPHTWGTRLQQDTISVSFLSAAVSVATNVMSERFTNVSCWTVVLSLVAASAKLSSDPARASITSCAVTSITRLAAQLNGLSMAPARWH